MNIMSFEEIKIKYQNKPVQESEVECKIIAKLKDGYLVEINEEWEGFIPNSHTSLNNETTGLNLEEPFKATIIAGPDKGDRYMVSLKVLKEKLVWEKLFKAKEQNEILKLTISKPIKGGAEVFIDGVRGFLPGRYIRLPGLSPEDWVNKPIEVTIEELDFKEKNLILNQKKAFELQRQQQAENTLIKLQEGDIVEATVLRIADFGVFVDLGGLDGLIPASELSWGRFSNPKDIVKIGDVLKARIFRLEKESQRVALSVKQILGDPWESVQDEYKPNMLVTGKVVSEAPFGLFVEIKPGIEALIHNSEIPEGTEKPQVGTHIKATILKIDLDQRKIGLSLKTSNETTAPYLENGSSDSNNWEMKTPEVSASLAIIESPEEIKAENLV